MKKILIVIYIIIFLALAYYVVTLFIDRDFKKEDKPIEIKSETAVKSSEENSSSNVTNSITETNSSNTIIITKDATYQITQEDCNDECVNIEDTDKNEYCNQVCGFSTIQSKQSCDDLTGLNKDYCLRDIAIEKKDLDLCEQITDAGIHKQCLNRINEDFIDEIMK